MAFRSMNWKLMVVELDIPYPSSSRVAPSQYSNDNIRIFQYRLN